jgi:hypothetical protein
METSFPRSHVKAEPIGEPAGLGLYRARRKNTIKKARRFRIGKQRKG